MLNRSRKISRYYLDGSKSFGKSIFFLYGTGVMRLNEKNEVIRVGGVKYTIKDGVIYDAKKLLQDVKRMVDEDKKERGVTEFK